MSQIRIQDDLYLAVNGEWLETAVIPDDRPTTGGFADLDQGVEKLMMADFALFAEGKKSPKLKEMKNAVKLYRKVLDVDKRNEDGINPALPYLAEILKAKTLRSLNKKAVKLAKLGMDMPFNFGVTEDMSDATKHCFIITGPSIILPDTTYYAKGNQAGEMLLGVYAQALAKILSFTPLTPEEQETFVKDTMSFDRKVSKCVKSAVEWADYVKNHNPWDVEDVCEALQPFDFKGFLTGLFGEDYPKTIIVYDPRAIKEFGKYFAKRNYREYLHWAYCKALLASCPYLSEELNELGTTYRRALTGVAKTPVVEKRAYQLASRFFSEPIGVYYGRTYFGEKAKADVVNMVKKIIETYKLRMAKNTFLEEETKKKAIAKLSTIEIKMGYPDSVREFYGTLKVSDKDSLFVAATKIGTKYLENNLEKLHKPVDRTEWLMPGHMVNACYNPSANDITFPAAILQKPFYSLKQSVSENLGGIGAVIGHEISHAFDNNGAHFDENGNLANWWSEKDFAAFNDLTKGMIEQFDGIEIHGGKVNGTLVVSENIADNGGMGVTLEIMHGLEKPNFQAYFKNWARVWCRKAKEQYMQMLLASDVHSPAELRANMTPRNFSEWYEAFDVVDTDKMYLPEDKRISIW